MTTATSNAPGGLVRATAPTAASRAKASVGSDVKTDPAAGKRKREALSEVTSLVTNNKTKGFTVHASKGKDKEVAPKEKFDGIVLKAKTSTISVRQPLRTVVGPALRRPTRSTAVALPQVQETAEVEEIPVVHEAQDVNAMVIDHPAIVLASSHLRRPSIRRSTHNSSAVPLRQSEVPRRISTHPIAVAEQKLEDDTETTRVFKRRRTSSDVPEEVQVRSEEDRLHEESEAAAARIAAELEAGAETEIEADPDGDDWEDLDAEDASDPLMVSEYVVDIFNYMKAVEVCLLIVSMLPLLKICVANDYAQPTLHGSPKRTGLENARHPDGLAGPSARPLPPPS